jgi:hypothetical protein
MFHVPQCLCFRNTDGEPVASSSSTLVAGAILHGGVFNFPCTSGAAARATFIRRSVGALGSRITPSRNCNGVTVGSPETDASAAALATVALFGVPRRRPPRRSPGFEPRGICHFLLSLLLDCYLIEEANKGQTPRGRCALTGTVSAPRRPQISEMKHSQRPVSA